MHIEMLVSKIKKGGTPLIQRCRGTDIKMVCYFDNAATTFPKPTNVVNAVKECIEYYCGNPGRSSHSLSVKCSERIYETREAIAHFLGFKHPENICFTQNATHALNIAIKGTIKEKCHCIISDIEHNSVLRPLEKRLAEIGGTLSIFDSSLCVGEAIEPLIQDDTKFIICTMASNVTGALTDIRGIEQICKRHGIRLIVDASQYLGHLPLNLSRHDGIDILCAPGHKGLFGIQGSGFILFASGTEEIDTLTEGGSGSNSLSDGMPEDLPDRFEAGTVSTPAIVSLCEGIRFLDEFGMHSVKKRIDELTQRTYDIISSVKAAHILGCENGICSFTVDGIDSEEVARRLDSSGICVRGGLHCSPLAHKKLGTLHCGTVRISLSVLNTSRELDKLYLALRKI